MMKRMLSLMLAVMALTALFLPAAAAEDDTPDRSAGYYYVKTENGKGLNVRNQPGGGKVVGSLKYGTRIYVNCFTTPEWALITYKYDNGYGLDDYAAWVSTRFLTRKNPGDYAAPTAKPASSSSAANDNAKALEEMNAEFKTAKAVAVRFDVYARPARASGWVNLRWAPTTAAERIATCPQGKRLTVLAETKNWYQVQDPVTGMIGFISKQYVLRQ